MDAEAPPPAYQLEVPGPPTVVPAAPPVHPAPNVPAPVPPARTRVPTATPIPAPEARTFELLLKIQQPSKRIRTAQRKLKTEKQDDISIGPTDIRSNITWEQFTTTIAEVLQTQPSNLNVVSFEWHWLKPANGPWLPLQTNAGFLSMIKQIHACKTHPYVLLHMQPAKQMHQPL